MTKDGFPQKLVDWELFALWRAKFAAGNAESSVSGCGFRGSKHAVSHCGGQSLPGANAKSSVSAACGFPGRTRADQLSKLIDGSIARAAAGMRAHLLLARLCLSLLVGPLHAINAQYEMCELVCAETPGMRWVLPCFIASSNVRVRTGNCEVNLLTE